MLRLAFDINTAYKAQNRLSGSFMLPKEIASSLSTQWPCRDVQIRQLASLLSVSLPRRQVFLVFVNIPQKG